MKEKYHGNIDKLQPFNPELCKKGTKLVCLYNDPLYYGLVVTFQEPDSIFIMTKDSDNNSLFFLHEVLRMHPIEKDFYKGHMI